MLASIVVLLSVLDQEIAWEERLQNYLFCVEWDKTVSQRQMFGFCLCAEWMDLLFAFVSQ